MRKLILAAALAATMGLAACERPSSETYVNSSGSVALSRDDSLIYAVDSDNEIVGVVDAATQKKIAEVKVGAAPEQIVVGPDDTIYVSNRGARSVSVIKKGDWTEASRIAVGVEPVGLAVSPDGKTLYVVNSTRLETSDVGSLTAVDTTSEQIKWDIDVGEEPRGITLVDNGRKALITLFKKGDIVQVDLEKAEVIKDNTRVERKGSALTVGEEPQTAVYQKANAAKLEGQSSFGSAGFRARSMATVTATPDGQKAFTTVVWSREDNIAVRPNTFGGYYASGGPCNVGSVATPGVVTYDAVSGEPMVDDLTVCDRSPVSSDKDYPTTTFTRFGGEVFDPSTGTTMQGPVATVVDPTGSWLFVLNRESENVAIMPTSRRAGDDLVTDTSGNSIRDVVPVGKGANGIAVTRDGKTLYVYNQFDHTLSVIKAVDTSSGSRVGSAGTIEVARDVLPADVEWGRDLFFSIKYQDTNNPQTTAVACNTCHVDGGREDGHVWGFPDGKRQTPALAGRMLSSTAPFHWSGEFATLDQFMQHTTTARMGGKGLDSSELNAITAYMDHQRLPDNPHQLAVPTEQQLRGAQLFQQANCTSCHAGEALTNNGMADVGTIAAGDLASHDSTAKLTALNVPSLLGIARTAPYLHDGSAPTLKARLQQVGQNGLTHGNTQGLTEAQVDDLVAYLKTL